MNWTELRTVFWNRASRDFNWSINSRAKILRSCLLHWSPCPFAPFQIAWQVRDNVVYWKETKRKIKNDLQWQVITCQVDLSSQLEQSSYHASVGPWLFHFPELHQTEIWNTWTHFIFLNMIFQGPTLVFSAQVEFDKSTWQVALVKLTCHPRLRPLFNSLDKWQLVKSTCQVNLKDDTPKITSARSPKNLSPRGTWGGWVRSQSWPKKTITFLFFWKYFSVKMMFLKFLRCSPPRDQIATWQCCCGVGGFSATTQP